MGESCATDLQGSCQCGGVQFRIRPPFRDVIACHCVQCRKLSGHFTAATAVRPEHLALDADTTLKWYRASSEAKRGFCDTCGSTLFWAPDSGDRISVYAGSLDGDTGLVLREHIFLSEQGDYYTIADDCALHARSGAALGLE
jgi:hypothetical protein